MADDTGTPGRGPKRVVKTGLALVHRNEVVLPAPGSEAAAERVLDDSRAVLEFYFPVEIEVRSAGKPIDEAAIADRVLRKLAARLDGENE